MDLDEMLRVDSCRDMDELIIFWARSGLYFHLPEPDCFLWYHISAAMRNFVSGESHVYVLVAHRCNKAWF